MSFPPISPVHKHYQSNNIIESDEEHVVEMNESQIVYTGNYNGCLFITANSTIRTLKYHCIFIFVQ